MSMFKAKINPKRVIIEHFDSLINSVDVHTEEQLQEYSSTDLLNVEDRLDCFRPPQFKKEFLKCKELEIYRNPYRQWSRATDTPKPNMPLEYVLGSTLVCDYLNACRNHLIEKLTEAQNEFLKHLETIKDQLDPDEESEERVRETLFAKRYPILIQFDEYDETFEGKQKTFYRGNPSPFRLYLIELDFYILESDMEHLR